MTDFLIFSRNNEISGVIESPGDMIGSIMGLLHGGHPMELFSQNLKTESWPKTLGWTQIGLQHLMQHPIKAGNPEPGIPRMVLYLPDRITVTQCYKHRYLKEWSQIPIFDFSVHWRNIKFVVSFS